MPRFLDAFSGEFVWAADPRMVPYAILSHTWRPESEGGEQSYGDVRALQDEVVIQCRRVQKQVVEELGRLDVTKPSQLNRVSPEFHQSAIDTPMCAATILSHSRLSDKIKEACKLARAAGYRLLWIDSCCIDKSSSAELSEAINSMYEWYRLADVCHVYLADVPDGEDPAAKDSHFRRSRWHRRGWTLQELIAPERVVFLSRTWRFFGTRTGLASTLEEITRVDFDILTGRAALSTVSVARRMSWAAPRETTRVEDRAYSLLGIFGVHMSPIYGEGTNAFLRLQEEVIRTIPDQSIFAWGRTRTLKALDLEGSHDSWALCALGLLASSPWDFLDAHGVATLSPADFALRLGRAEETAPPLHCVFTPQGTRVQLLCIDLTREPQVFHPLFSVPGGGLCDECLRSGRAHALALLQCTDRAGSLIGLPLFRQRPDTTQARVHDAHSAATTVSTHGWCGKMSGGHGPVHLVRFTGDTLPAVLDCLLPHPTEVSLLRYASDPPLPKSRQRGIILERRIDLWSSESAEEPIVQIAPSCVQDLGVLGFTVSPVRIERTERVAAVTVSLTSDPEHRSWSTGARQTIRLELILSSVGSLDNTTEATFSITTYSCKSPSGISDSSHTNPNVPADPALREAPCPDENGHRRRSVFSTRETSERVVADAQFVIHADADFDADACDLRVLRARLERPSGGDSDRARADSRILWLSFEISERFRHRGAVKTTPSLTVSSPVEVERSSSCEEDEGSVPRKRPGCSLNQCHVSGTAPVDARRHAAFNSRPAPVRQHTLEATALPVLPYRRMIPPPRYTGSMVALKDDEPRLEL